MQYNVELIPYYDDFARTLDWYKDEELCMQIDGTPDPYNMERLQKMYRYLCKNGDCWYVTANGEPVGDITLLNTGEIAIAICKEYQNMHIGKQAIELVLQKAKQKGFKEVFAKIYAFNIRSKIVFEAMGFSHKNGEIYLRAI